MERAIYDAFRCLLLDELTGVKFEVLTILTIYVGKAVRSVLADCFKINLIWRNVYR